jgi:Ca-activated chloride channel family protein
MNKAPNHYARLGLPLDATPDEVKHAYRDAARRLHPDTRTQGGMTELFLEVQQAYDVLSDPKKRMVYDDALPVEYKRAPAVAIGTLYSRSTLPRIPESQLIYVLMELVAQPDSAESRPNPPLNVCLVLDCSTSMQGTLMDTVKTTAIELIRQVNKEDTVSIVAFSDRAEVLVPATTSLGRAQIETNIRMLQTRGGTEIYQGLEKGLAEAHRRQSRNNINHMILITDGRTYGDEPQCLELAEQAAMEGIGISSLGIGSKWNDSFLDKLTSTTGGTSIYVSRPKDIRRYLKDKFSGLSQSYANNIVYSFEVGKGIKLRYAFRLQPETAHLDIESPLRFGSLPRESNLHVLLEFEVGPIAPDQPNVELAEGRITLDIPSRSIPTYTVRLKLNRSTSNDPDIEPPPHAIVQAMSKLTLYRMQERARQDVVEGNVREATRRLQNIASHLLTQDERELARTVLAEANNLLKNQSFSEEGEKRLKYGTRGLLLPANVEDLL